MTAPLAGPFPPAPPAALGPDGAPRFGAFAGAIGRVDVAPLAGGGVRGLLRRALRLKRWQWGCAATDAVLVSFAVFDAGFVVGAFAFAVDRASGEKVLDGGWLGLPGLSGSVGDHPGTGARAVFAAAGTTLRFERRSDRYQASLALPGAAMELSLDTRGAPAPFSLVAPVPGGAVNVTQKAGALPCAGELRCRDRAWSLDGGLGGLDYTQGLLARSTEWRWAFGVGRLADGTPLALNLVEGFNDGEPGENVLLAGRGPSPLPACAFAPAAGGMEKGCRIASADGRVDLEFRGGPSHRESRNLLLVRSRFVQVAGAFAGTLPGPDGVPLRVAALPGVAEEQLLVG